MNSFEPTEEQNGLSPHLSPLAVWAFSLGTAIGWGSLVVTCNSYLLQAGPLGSVLGIVAGALVMLVIARSYHYLINRFPQAGGAYTYAKEILGYDYGFLTAWFLALVYLAVLWANATSLPLFARYFLGDWLRVGYCFTVFGYDVYLGEAGLSIAAVALVAWLCSRSRKGVASAMVVLALLFTGGISVCFIAALTGHAAPAEPLLIPEKSAVVQVLHVVCLSSWAFIGFENVSHLAEEYAFPRTKIFRYMAAAVVTATALYVFVMLLSVMAYPPEYASWFEYLSDLSNLSGIKAMPAFYAAWHFMGDMGVNVLMAALLGLVLSSLIGNIVALSRLFFALAKDNILPERFAQINRARVPSKAIMLVALVSLPVPFLGRTAIGWIVDVTTIGATAVYSLVSAFAWRIGAAREDKMERRVGKLGFVLMIACALYLLLPNLLNISHDLAPESYFIFATWGILGFLVFRHLLSKDSSRRFGRSVAVWIGLLAVVMFVSFVWTNHALIEIVNGVTSKIAAYAAQAGQGADLAGYVTAAFDGIGRPMTAISAIGGGILVLASGLLISNFSYMSNWAQQSERELIITKDILDTDELTGLPSMSRFRDLAAAAAETLWSEDELPVALAFNIMGMKDFNANNGRSEGDRLLRAFAHELEVVFGNECCSRSAEDSFYAIAPQEGVMNRVNRLFERFGKANNGLVLPVRAGASLCEQADGSISVGFDHARQARDLDRKTWSSHVTWFSEGMSDEAKLRLQVLDRLDQAIAGRWIRPYYQAVVDASSGEACGEEALARWIDPELGFLSPGQFIPIVEKAGLMHKVDMHILDCVIEDFQTKQDHGLSPLPVSVNISLRDLGEIDVADEITRRVDKAGVSHDLFHIEFTESVASKDPEALHAAVDSLRARGFQVWMDDFGSGYSSLNSLKDFDFDVIKLDMDFLRGQQTAKTWDIVSGVIALIKRIGLRSLAEGVETQEQARILRDAGCNMLQGYLFSQPVPLDEVISRAKNGWKCSFEG